MAEFWRTKQFKIILKTWNKKLEKSGFEDAEVELRNDRALKQRATNSYRQADSFERESRLEYYRILGHLANNTEFQNELEKKIMLGHSEGETIKELGNALNIHRQTIRFIIRRWQMKWGIKHWSLKQMNLKK